MPLTTSQEKRIKTTIFLRALATKLVGEEAFQSDNHFLFSSPSNFPFFFLDVTPLLLFSFLFWDMMDEKNHIWA